MDRPKASCEDGYRVYLWRFQWRGCVTVWKIGLTGMEVHARLRAWSGWLGLTSVLSRVAAGTGGEWEVSVFAQSSPFADRMDARDLERALHSKYRALRLGNEMFESHVHFTPEFFSRHAVPDQGTLFPAS